MLGRSLKRGCGGLEVAPTVAAASISSMDHGNPIQYNNLAEPGNFGLTGGELKSMRALEGLPKYASIYMNMRKA